MTDEPILAESALKHGVDEHDIVHAYRNPIRIWDLGEGFTMMVGASAAGIFLEVGYIQGDSAVVVVHAMRAREKFLR
ncbi:hypothetical protein [Intrasporangium sp.]|uniref:hypothetical protein n=1 Tax=Intrasporangium sp. TaxID=1925024 RepID=UPI0032216CD3